MIGTAREFGLAALADRTEFRCDRRAVKRSLELARRMPHDETVLPYLLAALIVLMFGASPLADIGGLNRPLIGMTMIVVILAGLFALGGRGRFAGRSLPSASCFSFCKYW